MACKCKKCNAVIDGYNGNMVMLHDFLWEEICHLNKMDKKEALCANCIEKTLNRYISFNDFKPSIDEKDTDGIIPVNKIFFQVRDNLHTLAKHFPDLRNNEFEVTTIRKGSYLIENGYTVTSFGEKIVEDGDYRFMEKSKTEKAIYDATKSFPVEYGSDYTIFIVKELQFMKNYINARQKKRTT